MGKKQHNRSTMIPMGPCLTLTLVLVTSLAPQPFSQAASGLLTTAQRPEIRGSVSAELGLSALGTPDAGPAALLPGQLQLAPEATLRQAGLPLTQPLTNGPEGTVQWTRGP